ncbi:MAG: hypothetical protein PVF27_08470 [Gemmatimonadales bacterium]
MPAHLAYEVDGRRIAVTLDDPALARPLAALYPAYRPSALGRDRSADLSLDVRSSKQGFLVTDMHGNVQTCTTFGEVLAAFESVCTEALLHLRADAIPLHASGAVVQGRAVLALGGPGAGKSSLAVSWHQAGIPVLGDDVVLLGEDGRCHPFKRLFGIDASLLAALGVDPTTTAFWEAGATEAWYDAGSGPGWADAALVGRIAVVRYQPGAGLAFEPIPPAELLNTLVHSQLITVTDRARGFDRLARIATVPAYRVTFGSAREAAEAMVSRLTA